MVGYRRNGGGLFVHGLIPSQTGIADPSRAPWPPFPQPALVRPVWDRKKDTKRLPRYSSSARRTGPRHRTITPYSPPQALAYLFGCRHRNPSRRITGKQLRVLTPPPGPAVAVMSEEVVASMSTLVVGLSEISAGAKPRIQGMAMGALLPWHTDLVKSAIFEDSDSAPPQPTAYGPNR